MLFVSLVLVKFQTKNRKIPPMKMITLKSARLGSVSSGTLRSEDLLDSFRSALEGLIFDNGDYLSRSENFPTRDRLNNLIGEAYDAYCEDGETLEDEENASEIVNDLQDALNEFAPEFAYFGAHPGDGADFGFWPDIDSARENCEFVSTKKQDCPDADFVGYWLHVSDHGNVTLYSREHDGMGKIDREVWSVV